MKKNNFIGKTFLTKSSKETQKIGYDFAKTLKKGDVVCLYGDLGSGKTTFTQGLAKGLGIKNRIISPTFVIIRCYELQTQNSNLRTQIYNSKLKSLERFYHVDLYRAEKKEDVESLGIEEIIDSENNIVVIEWAEKLINNLPKRRMDISFIFEKDNFRKITFRSSNQ